MLNNRRRPAMTPMYLEEALREILVSRLRSRDLLVSRLEIYVATQVGTDDFSSAFVVGDRIHKLYVLEGLVTDALIFNDDSWTTVMDLIVGPVARKEDHEINPSI